MLKALTTSLLTSMKGMRTMRLTETSSCEGFYFGGNARDMSLAGVHLSQGPADVCVLSGPYHRIKSRGATRLPTDWGVCHAFVQRVLLESSSVAQVDPRTSLQAPAIETPARLDMAPCFADDGFLAGDSEEALRALEHIQLIMPGPWSSLQ